MYQLKFVNPGEIRMGSPFNIADIELSGDFVPKLDGFEFQDKGCVNVSGDKVLLVQWVIEKNEPGFKIWLVSAVDKTIRITDRFSGCCEGVRFLNNGQVEVTMADGANKTTTELVTID